MENNVNDDSQLRNLVAKIKILKNIKFKVIISLIIILFFIILVLFSTGGQGSVSNSTHESLNTDQIYAADYFQARGGNFTRYELAVIDYQKINSIDENADIDEEILKVQNKYFDEMYDMYYQYKEPQADFNPGYVGPYKHKSESFKITPDTSLITSTLYNNEYFADMLVDAKTNMDSFYKGDLYYDLHNTLFRGVENTYINTRKNNGDSSNASIVLALQILSKYQIKRVETYYITKPCFAGVYQDTTRHIEIINEYVEIDDGCTQYIIGWNSPDVIWKHKRIQGANYRWMSSTNPIVQDKIDACAAKYDIENYDDAEYDPITQHYINYDEEVYYELACDDYKEYMLGNWPTAEDIAIFCDGGCYKYKFIEAYYDYYVKDPVNGDRTQTQKDIEDIVFNLYSLIESYENATRIYNYCSNDYFSSSLPIGDLSCGGGYAAGDCSYNSLMVNLKDHKGNIIATVNMEDYIIGVALAEIGYTSNVEAVKTLMIAAKTFLLGRSRYNSGKDTSVSIYSSNRDQAWINLNGEGTYSYKDGKYDYFVPESLAKNYPDAVPWTGKMNIKDSYISSYRQIYASIKNYLLINNNLATMPAKWGSKDEVHYSRNKQNNWISLAEAGLSFNQILNNSYPGKKLYQCDEFYDPSYESDSSGSVGGSCNCSKIYDEFNRCEGFVSDSSYDEAKAKRIVDLAKQLIGLPYVSGDEFLFQLGQKGGDCSGLTTYVYHHVGVDMGLNINNKSRLSANSQAKRFKNRCVNEARPGDILFWASGGGPTVTHTGVFVGDFTYNGVTYKNAIIDSSSSNDRVVIRELWGTSETSNYPLVMVARPYAAPASSGGGSGGSGGGSGGSGGGSCPGGKCPVKIILPCVGGSCGVG